MISPAAYKSGGRASPGLFGDSEREQRATDWIAADNVLVAMLRHLFIVGEITRVVLTKAQSA